jgi:hypothetical protein
MVKNVPFLREEPGNFILDTDSSPAHAHKMSKQHLSKLDPSSWEKEFRREARDDKLAVLRQHLRGLELRAKPQLFLEGTIQVVHACLGFMNLDGQSYAPFLTMQTYDPLQSPSATYAFTFSLFGKAFARVLVARDLKVPDLADLYRNPWYRYKLCGYDRFWVTRADGEELSKQDWVRLQRLVTEDLRYDYSEEELDISFESIWFGDSEVMLVTVHDSEEVMEAYARELMKANVAREKM